MDLFAAGAAIVIDMVHPVAYGAVIYAKEYRRIATFYEQVANLTEREATEDYVLLESAAFQLVILQIPDRLAAGITIENPPRKRETTPIKLFLNVGSLEKARETAKLCGGELNNADKEWAFHGIKRCDGVDPEGNVFQLQEVPFRGAPP